MDYIIIKDFLANYSLPTLIIAVGVFIICSVLFHFLKSKISANLKTYLPFISCVVIYFAYDMIFVERAFTLKGEAFYAGILCGSLSVVFSTAVDKIATGKPLQLSATALLIEGILDGFITSGTLTETAILIENVLLSTEINDNAKKQNVMSTIQQHSDKPLTQAELMNITNLIMKSVDSIN